MPRRGRQASGPIRAARSTSSASPRSIVSVHPRTLRIYELEGLICPARTPTNIRLYSENDIRRVLWIRYLTQNLGVNLAGVRLLFELEERLGTRILETLITDRPDRDGPQRPATADGSGGDRAPAAARRTRSAPLER